jgi:hypothetical protein
LVAKDRKEKGMDDERLSHLKEVRIPSYGILETDPANGIGATTASAAVDSQSAAMSNGSANMNGTGSFVGMPKEFDSVITRPNGLSTISGVFAPVTISMFSALLFLRMGKISLMVLNFHLFRFCGGPARLSYDER